MVRYDRIWALCKETGKKRSYLSKAMGHSERYLLDARKQNTNIKQEELRILASELNTTPEYLTGETDDPGAKKDTTLSGDVSELSKDVQELIAICKSNPALASALLAVAQQIQKGQAVQE